MVVAATTYVGGAFFGVSVPVRILVSGGVGIGEVCGD